MKKKRHHTKRRKTVKTARFFRKVDLVKLVFTLFVLACLAVLLIDAHIRIQFEGKRWALPAKVYARPLELYAGSPISISDLKIELQGLGYQFVNRAQVPGQVSFSQSQAHIATRGFHFSDGTEPAKQLTVDFSASGINRIRDNRGKDLPLVRLEPVVIGGIYPLNNEDRELIQLRAAPDLLIDALIAIEDRDFYQHHGISYKGIARAMWANIRAGGFVQGGSTLTQQLIKNFYLTADRTLFRKLLEMPMAMLLELHYSKDEILEAYLNEVYLGQDGARAIHGFGLAAHYFFAQPIEELTLPQLAMLAGLVKGPSYYEPRRHPERAKQRRNLVLKVLFEQGKVSEQQYKQAVATTLGVVKKGALLKEAYPAYLDLVKRQLRREYRDEDLQSEGLKIFTSLDPISQRKAETALTSTINKLAKQHGASMKHLQGSMMVTDPQSGEVIAVVGGRDTRYKGFNRALDAQRPIGSLIKPAIYLAALEQGYTLASVLDDSPYKLALPNGDNWQPQNFDRQSHDNVLLYQSLAHSYNISTARLGMDIGLNNVIEVLERLGVNKQFQPFPSLLLGAQSLSMLDVTAMYQTIAAGGFRMPPRAIRAVTDSSGQLLSSYPFELKRTIDPKLTFLLQYNLQQVTKSGTASAIYNSLPASIHTAGKTGTSDQQRDSWFAGFTGNRLAIVWLGLDDNKPLSFTGSGGALKAWTAYIKSEPLQSFDMAVPKGVEYAWVDSRDGKLASSGCEQAIALPFIVGTEPTEPSACLTDVNPIERPVKWLQDLFR